MFSAGWVCALMLGLGSPLAAQGPGFQLAHLFTDPSATSYRLDFSTPLLGPVGIAPALMIVPVIRETQARE